MKEVSITLEEREPEKRPVNLLCFDLNRLPPVAKFVCLTLAVFVFYLAYGYLQELLFRLDGFRDFGWFLTLYQFFFYALFSGIQIHVLGPSAGRQRRIPLWTYVMLAVYTVATMGLSNASLGYLNYPTQVMFKCCKLIPVLIGGILIQGKHFGVLDVSAAVLMSAGLILFSLADSLVLPVFHPKGYVMISMALVADAIIGNVQEKAMKAHSASNTEVVFYSYSIGCIYIFMGTLVTGEFVTAAAFFVEHPRVTFGYGVVFALCGYLGVNVVLTLVREYGALIAVTVTTARKTITILLSFLFFAKPFTIEYLYAGIIIIIAIYLNVYSKRRAEIDALFLLYYRQIRGGKPRVHALSSLV